MIPSRYFLVACAGLLALVTACSSNGTSDEWLPVTPDASIDQGAGGAGKDASKETGVGGAAGGGGATAGSGGGGNSAGSGGSSGSCPSEGPAYVHGDLWAFWSNGRVACDFQHRWLWLCERRFGAGNCPEEKSWFDQCWTATGAFPKTTWTDSEGHNYPAPHAANYGVCQPLHWTEKNNSSQRPFNPIPCDTTTFQYDSLRTADPYYGNDWWDGSSAMRHLTLKVYDGSVDPYASEGKADGLVNLSTHPGKDDAFMDGLKNHSYSGHVRAGGCLPPFGGEKESPYPDNNFGAFFWVEVPTDRSVTLLATWQGKLDGKINLGCLQGLYFFPSTFAYHKDGDKPWLMTSPCWDGQRSVQLKPGRHYVWDWQGFRELPTCAPPEDVLSVVPESVRQSFREGTCSSM